MQGMVFPFEKVNLIVNMHNSKIVVMKLKRWDKNVCA
jgi:hypothetical protein